MIYHKDISVIPPNYQIWNVIVTDDISYKIAFAFNKIPKTSDVIALPCNDYYSYEIVEIDPGNQTIFVETSENDLTLCWRFIEDKFQVMEDDEVEIELYDRFILTV